MDNSSDRPTLEQLEQLPPLHPEPTQPPDEYTNEEVEQAKKQGKLKQKERLELELIRRHHSVEASLNRERAERERLQGRLDELGPRCKSLESMHTFDAGITTWASAVSVFGNAMVAIASFWGVQYGMTPLLVTGLVLTSISSVFIFGVHKWWMPKEKEKTP